MKHVIICDIDGTIADVRHRLHYIQNGDGTKKKKPDWDAFHGSCVFDTPFLDVMEVVHTLYRSNENMYRRDKDLYFLSGRNDVVREQTKAWLWNYGFYQYTDLIMRKAGDRRPDTQVKLEMIRQLGLTPHDVLCIFDDRQCVVDMWRENGYRVMQVAAWKE